MHVCLLLGCVGVWRFRFSCWAVLECGVLDSPVGLCWSVVCLDSLVGLCWCVVCLDSLVGLCWSVAF